MKEIKGKPIETSIGEIVPGLENDRIRDGSRINSGFLYMLMTNFSGSFDHEGKQVKFQWGCAGETLVLYAPNGRIFRTRIRKIIDHAVENGWLDPELRFEAA